MAACRLCGGACGGSGGAQPAPDRDGCQTRDRVWRALVQALAAGRAVFDFAGEKRLLEMLYAPAPQPA